MRKKSRITLAMSIRAERRVPWAIDVRLQLPPSEHEVSLVVDPLLMIDGMRRRLVASTVLGIAQALEMEIDLLVHGGNGQQVAQ